MIGNTFIPSQSNCVWRIGLCDLSKTLQRNRIAHYPQYCSKYNPIEHRLFSHVTRACKGVSLESIETAAHYMSKTETTKGLAVTVRIIDKVFELAGSMQLTSRIIWLFNSISSYQNGITERVQRLNEIRKLFRDYS